MNIEIAITFIKTFFMNKCTEIICIKSQNNKMISKNMKIFIIVINFIISILYALLYEKTKYVIIPFVSNLLCYVIYTLLFIGVTNKCLTKNSFLILIISISLSLILFSISSILSFIITRIKVFQAITNTHFEYIFVGVIQLILAMYLFKIKRFKDGFHFLKDSEKFSLSTIIGIAIGFSIIILYLIYIVYNNLILRTLLFMDLIFMGLTLFNWIRRKITNFYKKQMKDRTVEILEEKIEEKDKTINDLKEELNGVLKINHKYNHRISSMERALIRLGDNLQFTEEFANEYGDIEDALKELSKNYKSELYDLSNLKDLPKTNIYSIDKTFDYFQVETNRKNIEFDLKINTNINTMIENIIPKDKLETLLGDHIKDAIIAIEHSDSKYKNIKIILDKKDSYQIEIYDSGIEFEIDTLLKLGLEPITTHKMTGGSGIGFMTTFEIMKETGGSLVITEFPQEEENKYTKSVTIKFDEKNEYRICSYRGNKIKNIMKDRNIVIKTIN